MTFNPIQFSTLSFILKRSKLLSLRRSGRVYLVASVLSFYFLTYVSAGIGDIVDAHKLTSNFRLSMLIVANPVGGPVWDVLYRPLYQKGFL